MDDDSIKHEIHEVTTESGDIPPGKGEIQAKQGSFAYRIWDSFKENPNSHSSGTKHSFDPENAAENTANSPLERRLKGRHMQMIAIGGSIGVFYFFTTCQNRLTCSQVPACLSGLDLSWPLEVRPLYLLLTHSSVS